MHPSTRAEITVLVNRQHGIVSVAQVVSLGASRNLLSSWVRSGAAVRVGHGVYRLLGWPDSWVGRALAASLVIEQHGALSHWAAARILELPMSRRRWNGATIEATYFRRRRVTAPPVAAHESNVLVPTDVTRVGAMAATSATFTLGALAAQFHDNNKHSYFALVDASVAEGHASLDGLADLSFRLWACPGVPLLREAIERHDPAIALTRSERERRLFRLLRDAGIPLPDVNVHVVDADGRDRYLDFAWILLRLWIEFDSDRFHVGSVARSSDGRRQNGLVLLDGHRWVPLRFDDRDLFEQPERIVAEVRRALDLLNGAV